MHESGWARTTLVNCEKGMWHGSIGAVFVKDLTKNKTSGLLYVKLFWKLTFSCLSSRIVLID